MLRRSKSTKIKDDLVNVSELARELAQDKRFRKRLLSAVEHGAEARRRARAGFGLRGAVARLATDQQLLAELRSTRDHLQRAYGRVEAKKRGGKLRKLALFALIASAVAAAIRKAKGHTRPVTEFASRAFDRTRSTSGGLEDLTKEELYARAQEADIPGRSEMSKEELITALRGTDQPVR